MPLAMRAGELRVPLADVAVGEHCHVRRSACDDRVLTHGVVTRVDHGVATLALIGAPVRLAADVVVASTGRPLQVALGNHLLGCVLDGFGEIVERLHEGQAPEATATATAAPVQAAPLDYRQRRPILTPFATGIRALDALLTVGEGQRMGIFAAAGCGKTTLVEMLLANADCDVRVVALVGERGREVASFVDAIRHGPTGARTVVVQATSDSSPATRVNAAMVATRVAEYFRDQGSRVLLVMDSATGTDADQAALDEMAQLLFEGAQTGAAIKDLKGVSDDLLESVYAYAHRFYTDGRLDEAETFFRFPPRTATWSRSST